jgi:hypothetical protein
MSEGWEIELEPMDEDRFGLLQAGGRVVTPRTILRSFTQKEELGKLTNQSDSRSFPAPCAP